jgi:uncharacterized protein YndB with AHSA1/START domain
MTGSDAVTVTIDVRATREQVYEMFVDPAKLAAWIGIRAMLEPRPGGQFRFELLPGEFCSGRYVELDPPRRVVFTWGWESGALPVEPGSTTVEVELHEHGDTTRVHLTHRGLTDSMRPFHADGWRRFLARLQAVAEGRDPGEDPAAPYAETGPPAEVPPP